MSLTLRLRAEIAQRHIESLYPPDCENEDTEKIGRELMDNTIGNCIGYSNWRNLSDQHMVDLGIANLREAGEDQFIPELL